MAVWVLGWESENEKDKKKNKDNGSYMSQAFKGCCNIGVLRLYYQSLCSSSVHDVILKLQSACLSQVDSRLNLSRHGHVAVTVRPRRLSHLQLELRIRVALLRVGARPSGAVDEGLAVGDGDGGLGGVLPTEAGLRRLGGGLDALVGDRLGDHVFEELEVVLV